MDKALEVAPLATLPLVDRVQVDILSFVTLHVCLFELIICCCCSGIVLHSPILSGLRVLTESRFLACFDIFPNIDRVHGIAKDVVACVIHGKDDKDVPFRHGERLYEVLSKQDRAMSWWVSARGHNNILNRNERVYIEQLQAFLTMIDQQQGIVGSDDNCVNDEDDHYRKLNILWPKLKVNAKKKNASENTNDTTIVLSTTSDQTEL
jgi:hypothetical protein